MSDFIPRLSPDGIYGNRFYYEDNIFHKSGYGMPNCTAYAWGRFCEIQNKIDLHIPRGNAGQWWPTAVREGWYQTGQTPALGAIACYEKPGAAGHVGIVEKILPGGSWVMSQSAYKRPVAPYPPDTKGYFKIDNVPGGTNKPDWMGAYLFQGFIYCPSIAPPPTPPDPPTPPTSDIDPIIIFIQNRKRC